MKRILATSLFLTSAFVLVVHAQTVSSDGSSITPSSGGSLVTSDGTWTFGTQTTIDGTVFLLNGATENPSGVAGAEASGVLLVIEQGQLYSENNKNDWWVWQNGAWVSTSAPQITTSSGGGTTSCTGSLTNYYQPSIATPTGYGASYDLFSSQHELEVQVQNCPTNTVTLTVGSNQSNQYVYNKGYLYQSGSWQPITLNGTAVSGSTAWDSGLATASLNVTPTSWTYTVGYVCAWNGTVWQCGCAMTACTTNYWQLQAFEAPQSSSGGGSNGSGAGGQWGGTPDTNPIVISSSGNDSNPCTISSPCQTLGKAQQKAQIASDKTIYLRAGTYSGQSVSLGSSDNGETRSGYPGDAVDSAVLDGGGTVQDIFRIGGASNVTINGLELQNCVEHCIAIWGGDQTGGASVNGIAYGTTAPAHNDTVENCIIHNNVDPSSQRQAAVEAWGDVTNTTYSHNVVYNTASFGLTLNNYLGASGNNITGASITGNVVYNTSTGPGPNDDSGAIYLDELDATKSTNIKVTNNFIRDYDTTGYGEGIYLDLGLSNATISGNIITGNPGTLPSGAFPSINHALIINSGKNIAITGNIIDLENNGHTAALENSGYTPQYAYAETDMSGNTFSGNIVISGYTGGGTYAYDDEGSYGHPTVQNNVYWNYAGGTVRTDGNAFNDSSPITEDPQISGWTYAIAAGSPAHNLSNLPTGGWGPPGYVIPQTGTPPSSPH